ncbi:ATP-binding protein [Lachnospiraceae bacterium ZAX-1]
MSNELVNRPEYLNRLVENIDVDLIKIVTGIRRCGKSTLLDLFHKYLIGKGVEEKRIIHMNMESLKYRNLSDYLVFYDYISEQIVEGEKTYLIFDELQVVKGFEKAVESFRLDFDVDIYITGSNAYLLSSEFSTLLSGRYVEIKMLPLSFKEFLTFYDFKETITEEGKFDKYLQFGGLPILKQYKFNEKRSLEALEGIYSTVVLRDVLERSGFANHIVLEKIVKFLCSNIGSITSPNHIGNILSHEGDIENRQGVAGRTIGKYIEMLEMAFVFYTVGRYDVKGKQLLRTLEKHYIVDLGFRSLLLGYHDIDRGHILENVVFLELLRRDYHVYIGKVGDAEVDFVAEKPGEKIYIQVTESMNTQDIRFRELRPLKAIPDNFEKIVLSMDKSFINSYEGIKSINLIDWLLSE